MVLMCRWCCREVEEVWLELRGHSIILFLFITPTDSSDLSSCGRVQLLLELSSLRKMKTYTKVLFVLADGSVGNVIFNVLISV